MVPNTWKCGQLKRIVDILNPHSDGETCADGEICADIATSFHKTFEDDGYVISPGAAMVCNVKGESFMRGIVQGTIGRGENSCSKFRNTKFRLRTLTILFYRELNHFSKFSSFQRAT